MSVNVPFVGNAVPRTAILTTTAVTNLYLSQNKIRGLLNSLSVCNTTGGALTFTLTLTDNNAVVTNIYLNKSVAANDTFIMTQHEIPIPDGWSLDIKASAGTLHVVAVIVQVASTQG